MTENNQHYKRIKLDKHDENVFKDNKVEANEELDCYSQFKVAEADCGITHFVGNHSGFSGKLKQRYSDFVVHEITNSGEVVVLNDFTIPDFEISQKSVKCYDSLFTQENWAKIESLASEKCGEVIIDVSQIEKEERTAIHRKIAGTFPFLETNTIGEDDNKQIKITMKTSSSRSKSSWPSDAPPFLHFTLYQENRGTFDALSLVAKFSHTSAKNFQTAGCKDKRGISSQRVSVKKVLPRTLLQVNEKAKNFPQPVAVGNFKFEEDRLKLGDLKGNKFDIVIKEVKFSNEKDIEESFNSVKSKGFINYFGTQRFGFKHSCSANVGLAYIQKNWEKVIDLILSERPQDISSNRNNYPTFNECIRLWKKSKDANEAFKQFSWKHTHEGIILHALSKLAKQNQSNNYFVALCALPRNNRTMYMHAYQSLIWNKLASFRFEKYGMKVVLGDLLMFSENDCKEDDEDTVTHPVIADESNIAKASISDVVLPIVGSNVILPENSVKDKLIELLADDGISIDTFKSMSKQNMLNGAYRKFMQIPGDIAWSVHSYEDETEQIITTDLQAVNNAVCHPTNTGSKKLVKLTMSLPSSTYATVVIRELFRQDLVSKIS